jgi:hypothetical protein
MNHALPEDQVDVVIGKRIEHGFTRASEFDQTRLLEHTKLM